jgi:hypothetical protein
MPASIHKILVHGSQIIEHAPLPIGQLSKEAKEARNKEFKRVREFHSRKFSRAATNEDEINYLLFSSDPVIFALRKIKISKEKEMFEETYDLLIAAE